MKKAIIVVGPERTGTRIFTRIIIEGGAFGDYTHEQRMDELLEKGEPINERIVVVRRSYPHNGIWTNIGDIAKKLRKMGYINIKVVVTTRDWHIIIKSQQASHNILPVPNGMPRDILERERIVREAYIRIFKQIIDERIPFIVVSYENLLMYPEWSMKKIVETLGLPKFPKTKIVNGNEKYIK